MSDVRIIYAEEKYFPSFREALDRVAKERIYIATTEAPKLESVQEFLGKLTANNNPVYHAIDRTDRVVGWCDITPKENPLQSFRGTLGMGVLSEFRGQGIGSKLMSATLRHAKTSTLEKVELMAYTTNDRAIALYKKFGFEQEGLIRKYRKLDGKYYDCLMMGLFL